MEGQFNISQRYVIRPLTPEHIQWVCAIIAYASYYNSNIWPHIYPDKLTQRVYDNLSNVHGFVSHQINSGLSFGVFDQQHTSEQPGQAGPSLDWDLDNVEADAVLLSAQMNFSLVSVALAYDAFDPIDPAATANLRRARPLFARVHLGLDRNDERVHAKVQEAGLTLSRGGTFTRKEYEGLGLMKAVAHYLMHLAAARGFHNVVIDTISDAVAHVWMEPPNPFESTMVSQFNSWDDLVEDRTGQVTRPWGPVKQRFCRVVCSLK